eukprot:scaffold609901_cov20-Prasinocladus_malaysianus.AAC.1
MDYLAVTAHASPEPLCSFRAHTLRSELQWAFGFMFSAFRCSISAWIASTLQCSLPVHVRIG